MKKKTYKKPTAKVVELESASILAGSQTQAPSGYSINYDDEDEVPTITNSIWDR